MTEKNEQQPQEEPKEAKKKSKMIKVDEAEYLALQNELKDLKDKHVRLYAEFDNARKRMEREKQEFVKYANENVIIEFLEILDDLERTFQAAKKEIPDHQSPFFKGLVMVMDRTKAFLQKNGVKPIKALGAQFDHNAHEVMMQEETDKHEDNTVIEVFQEGYYLGEKVVRTAKVKLAKNNAPVQHETSSEKNESNDEVEVQQS